MLPFLCILLLAIQPCVSRFQSEPNVIFLLVQGRRTTHKFVKLQLKQPSWCQFCKGFIAKRSAKECIYCKYLIHTGCEEALENHPPRRYCVVSDTAVDHAIIYEASMLMKASHSLKVLNPAQALAPAWTLQKPIALSCACAFSLFPALSAQA